MSSEYVLFKKGHLNKRAGVWTPWTPPPGGRETFKRPAGRGSPSSPASSVGKRRASPSRSCRSSCSQSSDCCRPCDTRSPWGTMPDPLCINTSISDCSRPGCAPSRVDDAGLAAHVALGARRRVLSAGTDTPRPYHYVADSLTSPRRTS